MKQKLYACSITATIYGWDLNHAAYAVWSTSKAKAKELALAEAARRWPTAKGYTRYDADIFIVPPSD